MSLCSSNAYPCCDAEDALRLQHGIQSGSAGRLVGLDFASAEMQWCEHSARRRYDCSVAGQQKARGLVRWVPPIRRWLPFLQRTTGRFAPARKISATDARRRRWGPYKIDGKCPLLYPWGRRTLSHSARAPSLIPGKAGPISLGPSSLSYTGEGGPYLTRPELPTDHRVPHCGSEQPKPDLVI